MNKPIDKPASKVITMRATMRVPAVIALFAVPLAGLHVYFYSAEHHPQFLLLTALILAANGAVFAWMLRTYVRYQDKGLTYRNGFFPAQKIRAEDIAACLVGQYMTIEIYHVAQRSSDAPEDAYIFNGPPAIAISLGNFAPHDIIKFLRHPVLKLPIDEAAPDDAPPGETPPSGAPPDGTPPHAA